MGKIVLNVLDQKVFESNESRRMCNGGRKKQQF